MLDTHQSVAKFLQRVFQNKDYSFVGGYGEPGYHVDTDAKTPMVVMADYWCHCNGETHGMDTHYPYSFERMEENGVEFEWFDEWIVDHESNKAYRCVGDSYFWKPSYVMDENGDLITIDDDIELWIEWAENDHTRAIPGHIYNGTDLEENGFSRYNGTYEHGFHPGQNAKPKDIDSEIREHYGNDVDVVFVFSESSQFYIEFESYYRMPESENDE